MMKVEVTGYESRQVVKKSTGEVMQFQEGHGYFHGAGKYPFAFKFSVAKGVQPYPPGLYELDPACMYAGDFGKLSVQNNLMLIPLAPESKK